VFKLTHGNPVCTTAEIFKKCSKIARPFLFKIIEMWFKLPIKEISWLNMVKN
jgi:hypothetical protein